jgi:hypothetical protein
MASNSKTIVRRNMVNNSVDEVIFRGIVSVVEKHAASVWMGTMTDLTIAVNRVLSRKQRMSLPGSPGALRVVINRIVNRLRNRGISVKFGRSSDHTRTRFVRFAR